MKWIASVLAVAVLAVLAVAAAMESGSDARADAKSMGAMSLDMDPAAAPANSATSLGSREGCARINVNGTLDGDEDTTADTVTADLTATDIPAGAAMQSFAARILYDESVLTVQTSDATAWMIAAVAGSSPFAADDPVPDTDGNGSFAFSTLDVGPEGTQESGSGVLNQITVSADAGAAAGLYSLAFVQDESIHGTLQQTVHKPASFNTGWIAIDQECVVPTDTPAPAFKKGDNDCDNDVDTVDALKGLRHVAGLPVSQTEPCTDLGTDDPVMGDMDCDDDVDSVDSLKILRHVAGLPNNLPGGCAAIGV